MTNSVSFISRFQPDGATSMVCRETGETYLIGANDWRGECYCYREGEFFTYGLRAIVLNAVESDARWSVRIREQHRMALEH